MAVNVLRLNSEVNKNLLTDWFAITKTSAVTFVFSELKWKVKTR